MHDNLDSKAEELKKTAEALFQDAEVSVEFPGARRLLELARRRPKTTYELRVSKNFSAVNGHVVLVRLARTTSFCVVTVKRLERSFSNSNVRDFQGDTEVNAEIVSTLKNEKAAEFWWMNNGVTILASRATLNGDTVTIEKSPDSERPSDLDLDRKAL